MSLLDKFDVLKKGSMKGQAAMEYLMTYGWALLVIVIVLAILVFYLPRLVKPPQMCMFNEPGFSCNEPPPVIVSESSGNVRVYFKLSNTQGKSIVIKGLLCTTLPEGDITKDMITEDRSVNMAPGQTKDLNVTCVDENKNPLALPPNSDFRGTIAVLYNYVPEVSGAPTRIAKAGVTGTVIEE